MSGRATNYKDIYDLLDQLCSKISLNAGVELTEKQHRSVLRHVTSYISSCPNALGSLLPYDEASLIKKIVNKLSINANNNNNDECVNNEQEKQIAGVEKTLASSTSIGVSNIFLNLFEQLKASHLDPRQRSALLTFLFFMANARIAQENGHNHCNGLKHVSIAMKPSPLSSALPLRNNFMNNRTTHHSYQVKSNMYSGTGIGRLMTSTLYEEQKVHSMYTNSGLPQEDQSAITTTTPISTKTIQRSGINNQTYLNTQLTKTQNDTLSHTANDDLVQNVIYSFTGIQGKYLKKDIVTGKFKLDVKAKSLNVVQAGMLLRLSEVGYYHDLVQSYTDNKTGLCALGLMGQGFISALRNEITKYYGMVAILQEQLNRQRNLELDTSVKLPGAPRYERLTLLKLLVWSMEPLERLQWLAKIAEACREKKGGALATTVHGFLNNGNPLVKNLAQQLLIALCGPLYQMLSRWLLEGEINDLHGEFFIECLSEVSKDRLWHDKYRVRTSMLPGFIQTELAHKILVTGKNINFLCEICEDRQPVKGRDDLRRCIEENPENIFSFVADTKLHAIIDVIYLNTSKRVLDMVVGPHKLLDHLQAMRRYLLLGQGDFICSLMENLKVELDKPASDLYSYDLSSIMDAAIRSTNAHYEDPEILNHLDVRLLKPCTGDVGWDILMLQYTVRGPLSTMLEPSMIIYQILFKPLWRMKHMEFVLSTKIWKEQKCNTKALREMSNELQGVLYRLHLFTSEMIHFIHQMEYYILFEVIECAWAELQERVQQAKALDEILNAHNDFLNHIKSGVFLDNDSEKLNGHLECVYEGIVNLEIWQEKFYQLCFNELTARRNYKEEILRSEAQGDFGVTNEKQAKRGDEKNIFKQDLKSYHITLENIGAEYERGVRNFLLALNSHNDHNLQLFGMRLDFNEYYKKRDQSLNVPLTFERLRMSSVYNANNRSMYGNRHSIYGLYNDRLND